MQVTVRSSRAIRTARSIRWRAWVGVHAHLDVLVGDVLEQGLEVDLLLEVAAQPGARLLADDRDHRLMIELGVVEPVEQVDRSRARGRHADADLPGELRVGAGHERRHLLVAGLDEARPVGSGFAAHRAEEADDPVAGVAEDARDPPVLQQSAQHVFADVLTHVSSGIRVEGRAGGARVRARSRRRGVAHRAAPLARRSARREARAMIVSAGLADPWVGHTLPSET